MGFSLIYSGAWSLSSQSSLSRGNRTKSRPHNPPAHCVLYVDKPGIDEWFKITGVSFAYLSRMIENEVERAW